MTIRVGAVGLGEVQRYPIEAPEGVNLATQAWTLVLEVTRARDDATFGLAPLVVVGSPTASSALVEFVPLGSEFTEAGIHYFTPTLTVDGNIYRMEGWPERVEPR